MFTERVNIMRFGVLLNSRNLPRRPKALPPTLTGLRRLVKCGLSHAERNDLRDQVDLRWNEEKEAYQTAREAYVEGEIALDNRIWREEGLDALDLPEEALAAREKEVGLDLLRAKWEMAKKEWEEVSGEWLEIIGADYPHPRLTGVTLFIDIPLPTGELREDGLPVDRIERRDLKREKRRRVNEAKRALAAGEELPSWAVELPLAKVHTGAGEYEYVKYTTTGALKETLSILRGWNCEGLGRWKMVQKIELELEYRRVFG